MHRTLLSGTVVAAVVVAAGVGTGPAADAAAARPRSETAPRAPVAHPMRFPLLLVENRGQTDADVVAYARGHGTSVFFTKGGVTYSLRGTENRWTLKADFVGARTGGRPELSDAAPTVYSWFKGPKDEWKTGARTFRTIAYRDLWPGIDLVWTAGADELKYEFVVAPGADPSRIRFAWRGATGVAVGATGALEVMTPAAVLRDAAPVSFQDVGGRRIPVASSYEIDGPTSAFRVGAYDADLPLVIDPVTILYAGLISGEGEDVATGVTIDDIGGAYVSGYTAASEATFPRIAGPDLTQNGGDDAFVAKVTPGGAFLEYVGYIGGDATDYANAIAVDGSRHAYVVGSTASSQATFPALVGPILVPQSQDAFVAKLSTDGTSLLWCGYIGGSGGDVATGVAVDKNDNAYVTGTTTGGEASFPVAVGPRTTFDTSPDAFVAKVRADGTGLVYAGFIGGIGTADEGHAIAVDDDGAAYVAGRSNGPDFPFTVGPGLVAKGSSDAFIAKVKPDGTGLAYAGFIAGSGYDTANAVAVDSQKRAYVAGTTGSNETTFPVKVGPDLTFQIAKCGDLPCTPSQQNVQDAFVARVKADGSGLEYCGYIGGFGKDAATGIAVNDVNQAFVTGNTTSTGHLNANVDFPFIGGPVSKGDLLQSGVHNGGGFITRVKATGAGLVTSGFIGSVPAANAIALGELGNAYVVGATPNTVLYPDPYFNVVGPSFPSKEPHLSAANDAFIVKFLSPLTLAPVNSFLLPSQVTATYNAKSPAKSKLSASGTFNLGTVVPNWTSHATLDVGGLHFDMPSLTANKSGTKFGFSGGGLNLLITPSASGSSKAAFSLTYVGDLTGKVGSEEAIPLQFADDSTTATSTVELAGGRFRLSAPHGKFVTPDAYIAHVAGKVLGEGKDTLSLTLGLATDGTTPPSPSGVTITFGDFTATYFAEQFTRKGSRDVFSDAKGDVTSVVVDYAKQTITLTGHKLTLGTFTQGANPVDVTVEFDDDYHEVQVRVVVKGTSLSF